MRLIRTWCLTATIGIGTFHHSTADAADAPVKDDAKPSWFMRLVSGGDSKEDKEKTFADAPTVPRKVFAPYEPGVLTDALRSEQEAWDRRLEVCRKLREHAGENEALLRQIDDIEKKATTLYHQRVAKLGIKGPRKLPADDDTQRFTKMDRTPIAAGIPSVPAAPTQAPATAGTFQVVNP